MVDFDERAIALTTIAEVVHLGVSRSPPALLAGPEQPLEAHVCSGPPNSDRTASPESGVTKLVL
jgi:hypothetical protein